MTEREALKLALEALEYEPIGKTSGKKDLKDQAITAIKEALAQPEQEPVAWRGYNWGHSPDDWVYRDFDDPILDGNGNNVGQPLYTTPPQRTWVGLTDEEVHDCLNGLPTQTIDVYARRIEAKLKEKNT